MVGKIITILQKNNVRKASLFGSYARGDETAKSDVDILVAFKGRKSYFDLVALEQVLEEQLQKKVDLLTYSAVDPKLRKSIFEDEVKIL